MAVLTGANLLEGVLTAQGVVLSAPIRGAVAARLQGAIDAGSNSNLQIGAVLAALVPLRDSVQSTSVVQALALVVGQVKADIADDGGGTSLDALATAQSRTNTSLSDLATAATPYMDALLSGFRWDASKPSFTYSFNETMPSEYVGAPNLTNGWQPPSAAERNAARDAFAELNGLLGVQFVEVAIGGDIRFNAAITAPGVSGFAYYPGPSALSGDVWLDVQERGTAGYFDAGGFGRLTVWHELGHALGLKHSFETPVMLPNMQDTLAYTLMTYNSEVRTTYPTYFVEPGGLMRILPVDPMPNHYALLDVQALQVLYGANAATRAGIDAYSLDTTRAGYLTIWDAGGTDIIDVSDAPGRSVVDLRGGTVSSIGLRTLSELVQEGVDALVEQGAVASFAEPFVSNYLTQLAADGFLYDGTDNLAIVQGVVIELLHTGDGNDEVWDNAVDNFINTGSGDDMIYLGAGGFDRIDAGLGWDAVVFDLISSAVQLGPAADGALLVVGENFSARLVGVEELHFSDGVFAV